MEILLFAPHWGSNHLAPQDFIARAKDAGFDGVEMSLPLDDAERAHWCALIDQAGLRLIAQQWETVFHPQFESHREAYARYLRNACAAGPLFVNSHSGRDIYTPAQNLELLDLAASISADTGVPIYHEIHRARFSGHPMLTLPYLAARPQLQLTADLSHWCCACETLLEDQPHTLDTVLPCARHVHARVGHSEGPQVTDFRAPEWRAALEAHLAWWDRIVDLRRAAGASYASFTPEFGPAPYTSTLPYTQMPVSDAWELNVAMKDLLRARYA
ncbi:sugar phosphate isomerase/epimerase [Massilia sp. TS11]|uniref:sugar phosphate isomerase/epimerase family protein n=1 Tax=Massilia sp. TS11 TaxID=2908003 RepID=UPI001EDA0839|nr:sugar phosphate isomerase/epimerase [Massilia sp. TS11]MCG2583690.1 sugar phosphate isomerase/epimerase [Massilia sp. TS11]